MEFVDHYVGHDQWFRQEVRKRLDRLDRGEFIPHDELAAGGRTIVPSPMEGRWSPEAEPVEAGPVAARFYRVFRFGDRLVVPTRINDGRSTLFLVDSRFNVNWVTVRGIQGKVNQTSVGEYVSLFFA